jgi:putative membrane protein
MTLSTQDRDRVAEAIRAAEAKTSGEIVCVLARTSSPGGAFPILIAAAVALALPWALVALTTMSVHRILAVQAIVFLGLATVLCLPGIRERLMPRRARRALAHRAAMEQFVIRGIARKQDRCGILIFVSLAERYARIVADDGIAARVPRAAWQSAVDELIGHMRDGRIADGFLVAIARCGDTLAQHFPRTEPHADQLPDKIYVV